MPRFSIVIPTYNRARFLSRSIESALNQTHPDVEVIVSDNASTDDTRDVVRQYGDRVRYHRNETNLGLWGNFALSPELATGEYFSWLTDDDFVRDDFATRAIRALDRADDVNLYVCWAAHSPSPTSLRKKTTIHGPLIPIDWHSTEATIVDGLAFVPFTFFESQAMPPAVALKTAAAREGVKHLSPDCLQYNEYIFVTAVAARSRVAIDPWIGVVHIHHDRQAHIVNSFDVADMLRQKRAHADFCQRFMPGLPDRWRDLFRQTLSEIPVESRVTLLADTVHNPENRAEFWASAPPVVTELRDMVLESLPQRERTELSEYYSLSPAASGRSLKRLIPPRLRKTLGTALWTWKSYEAAPR